jgi:hypothetical protein
MQINNYLILHIKHDYSIWGDPKIREKLIRLNPMISQPAISTVHATLNRNSLVKRQESGSYKEQGTELFDAKRPNQLWYAAFLKGVIIYTSLIRVSIITPLNFVYLTYTTFLLYIL